MPRHFGHRLARAIHTRVTPLVKHPLTIVVVGLSMLITGVSELLEDLFTDFETVLESYHGLILFGLVTAMRGFSEMVEALEWLDRDFETFAEGADDPMPLADPLALADADPAPAARPGRAA
jgi:hypothetical protein